jgi:1-deoxy-D-xylulose-5-phosphate synthase
LLEKISSPADLKILKIAELDKLSQEIRERIIEVVCANGGHLASSLGAVELIIALHYCLDCPRDKIIFDVGHQSYAHKIITGRNKDFGSLRQYQGISGFPSSEESVYDIFTTGHSSNAVSLALGLVSAAECLGQKDAFKVAAVIGDGSLSGGLCFEGLNNAGHLKKDMLVVLNTNELSIAPNVGALSTYLNKLISLPIYNHFKDSLEGFVRSRMPKGSRLMRLVNRFEEGLKGLFVPGIFFEELGFRYFGPLDGHNLQTLIPALKNILSIKGPKLLHLITKKGKGYSPAEKEPVKFHGIGPFARSSGITVVKPESSRTYTEVFSEKLLSLARDNKKIVAITAAMPEGTGLDKFRDAFTSRYFDAGIAEGHAVSFAAGLAKQGLKPVVAIYSTFLQRAYDQIMEDVALQNLGVVFAVDRAGIAGEDGATHQGIFDIAFLRSIPNMVLMAPKDTAELEIMLEFALNLNRPVAIRYPKDASLFSLPAPLELGRPEVLKKGMDFVIFALGSMVYPAKEAAELLETENLSGTVVNARFAKPLDALLYRDISSGKKYIFSVEDGILEAGFGSAVQEILSQPVERIGLECKFIPHGSRELLLEKCGLSPKMIAARIRSKICPK